MYVRKILSISLLLLVVGCGNNKCKKDCTSFGSDSIAQLYNDISPSGRCAAENEECSIWISEEPDSLYDKKDPSDEQKDTLCGFQRKHILQHQGVRQRDASFRKVQKDIL